MGTTGWVLAGGAGVVLALFGVGMSGFLQASRESGVPYVGPSSAMQIYRHAFGHMKESRAGMKIIVGFGGMILVLVVGLSVAGTLSPGAF